MSSDSGSRPDLKAYTSSNARTAAARSGQQRLSPADEDRTWTPTRDRLEEPTVQKRRNNQKRAVFEVRVGEIPGADPEREESAELQALGRIESNAWQLVGEDFDALLLEIGDPIDRERGQGSQEFCKRAVERVLTSPFLIQLAVEYQRGVP